MTCSGTCIFLYIHPYLSMYLSVYCSSHLSIHDDIHLSIHSSIYPFRQPPIHPSIYSNNYLKGLPVMYFLKEPAMTGFYIISWTDVPTYQRTHYNIPMHPASSGPFFTVVYVPIWTRQQHLGGNT